MTLQSSTEHPYTVRLSKRTCKPASFNNARQRHHQISQPADLEQQKFYKVNYSAVSAKIARLLVDCKTRLRCVQCEELSLPAHHRAQRNYSPQDAQCLVWHSASSLQLSARIHPGDASVGSSGFTWQVLITRSDGRLTSQLGTSSTRPSTKTAVQFMKMAPATSRWRGFRH